jgi:hypothetical protein
MAREGGRGVPMVQAALLLLMALAALGCGGATTLLGGDGGTSNGSDGGPRGPTGSVVENGGTTATADAGPGGTVSSLPCGVATCVLPAETCCVTGQGTVLSFACVAGPTCPQGDAGAGGSDDGGGPTGDTTMTGDGPGVTALKCSGQANCPAGTVCCATAADTGASSSCVMQCGRRGVQLCDPAAATSGCSASEPCATAGASDLGLPPTFGVCGSGN